jgi:MFS family permease
MSFQTPTRSFVAFYASAALWNLCMGMMQVTLPLYALSLGFSILKISSLISLPILTEITVRFLGSALSDRFGERRILQVCYVLMVGAGLVLVAAENYLHLFVAQAVAYFSRAVFWSSAQSLASQLPGPSIGKKLGRLSACNYGSALVGLIVGGIVAAQAGYTAAFVSLTLVAAVCALISLDLPRVEPKPGDRSVWRIVAGIGPFLRHRRVWLAISISFAAAIPPTLTASIYPIYLGTLEYSEKWIGVALSARSLGPVFTGLMIGALFTPDRQVRIYALGMAGVGIFLAGTGLTESLLFVAISIAALGAAGGVMDLLYQIQASEISKAGDRTVAMATMGIGWILCPLITPLALGWLAETHGFRVAFLVGGAFFLLMAFGAPLWHRLLAPEESSKEFAIAPSKSEAEAARGK